MDSFTYKLPNGKYEVKLHFCETYEGITGPGERVFTFDVQGKSFKNFDVWVKAGGFARPYVETVPVEITDGGIQHQVHSPSRESADQRNRDHPGSIAVSSNPPLLTNFSRVRDFRVEHNFAADSTQCLRKFRRI